MPPDPFLFHTTVLFPRLTAANYFKLILVLLVSVSFALQRGEMKEKNRETMRVYMDILKTGLDTC